MSNDSGQPPTRKTAAYSLVDPERNKIPLTMPMSAVEMKGINQELTASVYQSVEKNPLSVKDVITQLIEIDVIAWKCLPECVRNLLLESPQDFQFVNNSLSKTVSLDFDIVYNKVVMRWNGSYWRVFDILK